MREIEDFFRGYGDAVAAYDVDGVAARYARPCLLISDEYAVAVTDPGELRAALSLLVEVLGTVGVTRVEPAVQAAEPLGDRMVSARVRWSYLDGAGSLAASDYHYLLRAAGEGWRVTVAAAVDGQRELRALADRLGVR